MVVSHQRCPCRDGAIHGSFSRGIGRSDRRNGRERRIDGLTHRDIDSDIKRRCQIDCRSLAPPRAVPRYSIKTSTRWNKNNKSMHQTVKLVFANKCWTSCREAVSWATDATGISIASDAWVAVTVSKKSHPWSKHPITGFTEGCWRGQRSHFVCLQYCNWSSKRSTADCTHGPPSDCSVSWTTLCSRQGDYDWFTTATFEEFS